MTSTVRYFRHDDAGAPTLSGTVGSLTALLRACLVGTAGVAYGSKASAGWTEEFIGAASNIAVFRNNQSEDGCGCYVLVNDNAPGAGGARESRINVYATMSNISTGVNGTATTFFRKSSALSSAARPWLVIADGRTAWVYVFTNGDSTSYGFNNSLHGFGDFESQRSIASANRYFVLGRQTENANNGGGFECFRGANGASNSLQMAVADGLTSPAQVYPRLQSGGFGYGGAGWPADVLGDVLIQKMPPAFNGSNVFYGVPRGLYIPLVAQYASSPGSLISGSDRLVIVKGSTHALANETAHFAVAVDSIGPW